MNSNKDKNKLTPAMFHALFSLAVGVMAVLLVHSHQVILLLVTHALWLSWFGFIGLRARKAGGLFLEQEFAAYPIFGIPSYFAGLSLAACFHTVIR
jgi:hypothetical protein